MASRQPPWPAPVLHRRHSWMRGSDLRGAGRRASGGAGLGAVFRRVEFVERGQRGERGRPDRRVGWPGGEGTAGGGQGGQSGGGVEQDGQQGEGGTLGPVILQAEVPL